MALEKYKVYGVISGDNKEYKILDEELKFKTYPIKYFVSNEKYKELSKEELTILETNIYTEIQSNIFDKLKEEEEKVALKLEKQKKENTLKLIKDISKAINSNLTYNSTKEIIKIPKVLKINSIIMSLFFCGYFIFNKDLIGIILILLFFGVFFYQSKTKTKEDERFNIDINFYEKLKAQNLLPLELLGKIKLVENEIIILKYLNVNKDIIKLLQSSINLTIFISTNEQYYNSNKKKIDTQLTEFLDNTLKYIETLKENRKIESLYIENQISQDILNMIDKNNELFKDLIKDNHYLVDIYKN